MLVIPSTLSHTLTCALRNFEVPSSRVSGMAGTLPSGDWGLFAAAGAGEAACDADGRAL